jgi:glycoprotein-mannosyl O6-kinase
MNSKLVIKLIPFFVVILSILVYYYYNYSSNECSKGYFRIGDMKSCHKLLDCNDYNDMKLIMLLGRGLVKNIYLVKWHDHHFIFSNLTDPKYSEDFINNIRMLEALSPNPLIVQLIGSCGYSMLFTEYHSYGDATVLPRLLSHELTHLNNLSVKFNLCINYVQILHLLHNSPIGTRVMCDSNTVEKTLSQYLVTNDLGLVLNDLDALPQVKRGVSGVKCGHRQLFGSFVAPEQLWPSNDKPFNDEEMPEYDEKTDIWKIPQVCEWILNIGSDSTSEQTLLLIKTKLSDIHQKCKQINPQNRPSAKQVLDVYQKLLFEIKL